LEDEDEPSLSSSVHQSIDSDDGDFNSPEISDHKHNNHNMDAPVSIPPPLSLSVHQSIDDSSDTPEYEHSNHNSNHPDPPRELEEEEEDEEEDEEEEEPEHKQDNPPEELEYTGRLQPHTPSPPSMNRTRSNGSMLSTRFGGRERLGPSGLESIQESTVSVPNPVVGHTHSLSLSLFSLRFSACNVFQTQIMIVRYVYISYLQL
jgi:hypothetical protein